MRRQWFASMNRLLPVIGAGLLLAAHVAAQTTSAAKAANDSQNSAKKWRTPWGDPDLQGSWSNATTTPLQRPDKYAGREFLTPAERAAIDKNTEIATDKRSDRGTPEDVSGAYNGLWWDRGRSDGRTSLIYDPKDGRIPPLTPQAKQRLADLARLDKSAENYL